MRRRGFIAALAGAAASPLAAHAQQPERTRRLGVLMAFSGNDPVAPASVNAFTQALGRLGWIEGKNIQIDYRFAAGDPALLAADAAELVGLSPDAILATSTPSVEALRSKRAQYQSFSYGCPIPSDRVLLRAWRDPAAISPGSAPLTLL